MIRLGLAQINATVGDIDGNTRRILEALASARHLGVQIVAFPELATTGYPPDDLLLKPDFVRANLAAVGEVTGATSALAAVVGFVDAPRPDRPELIYNAAAVLCDGQRVGTYHKRRLPNYGVFDEKRYFQQGRHCPVFAFGDAPVGVTICEDIWFPGGPPALLAWAGALLLININASPYHAGKWQEREAMLTARARAYAAVVAYVNLVGGQDELVFDGTSVVIGHDGRVLARGAQFIEDLVVCDVDLEAVRRARAGAAATRGRPAAAGRLDESSATAAPPATESREAGLSTSPEDDTLPTPVVVLAPLPSPVPPTPAQPHIAQPLPAVEEVYRALELGLRDYVGKNGFRDVVLGLSGGVDSALVATLAVDALGSEHVHAAFMPSPYTSRESRRLVGDVAARLGLRTVDIGIGEIFQAFLDALAPVFVGRQPDVAEENIQARIRGTLLMALSNKFGWLLLATGNKSEYSCGYATLYGDMAGGFALLKDVPKTLVYELARWRNRQGEVIPEEILRRPPTAELRPGQLDTDSLPPYEVLDPILKLYVEADVAPEEIVARGYDRDTVARVVRMVDRNEYKRRQAPPGVKITPKAFGRDRRLPITNRYRGGLERPP
ncbi:MAG: NAD+ synthase [Armatimonadota bacterium]|nr:NAD+ synthase [Armatimonadota bacterium]